MLSKYRMKKGQGLSLQVIVIALICLIILVILIAIVSGKLRGFGEGASSCTAKGGTCGGSSPAVPNGGCGDDVYLPGTDCEKNNKVCCVPL